MKILPIDENEIKGFGVASKSADLLVEKINELVSRLNSLEDYTYLEED